MAKQFKASGILYSDGEKIGTTEYKIASDYLEKLVEISPKKLPVMNNGGVRPQRLGVSNWKWNSSENIIGYAELEYVNDGDGARIIAHITFNQFANHDYEQILQSKERRKLRLGFYMNSVSLNTDDKLLHDGVIRSIMLSDTCCGGHIYKFGWE